MYNEVVKTEPIKPLKFVGTSKKDLKSFPDDVIDDAGFELYQVQIGEEPTDWKPMPTIGNGASEIRIRNETGAYRVTYVAKFEEAVFVLHCFQKKTQKTEKRDIELGKTRFNQLVKELRK